MKKYYHFRSIMSIASASFRSITRSWSAVIFSLAFPLVFIVVFANLGSRPISVEVGVAKTCDTINPVYQALKKNPVVHFVTNQSAVDMNQNLSKGNIDVILDIRKNGNGWTIYPPLSALPKNEPQKSPFDINVTYTKASNKGGIFKSVLSITLDNINKAMLDKMAGQHETLSATQLHETTITGREYKYIDFLLPGMLGFSLLSSGVFGTAFVFLSLRLTLVIKRFFATPVRKYSIILGEALARLIFSWIGALFIILAGHYFYGFTLIHGFATVVNLLILSAIGLIIFMGFGFIVSGIAKNESSIPPISNIITLPQFLLAGTFFSISALPGWLQNLSNILPLTYLNQAMRNVSFEGAGLGDITHQLLILGIWFVIVYAVAVKTFKWEA